MDYVYKTSCSRPPLPCSYKGMILEIFFLQSTVLWYVIESPRLDLFKQCSISSLETSSLSMWTIDPSLFFPCVHFQLNLVGK